MELRVDQRRKSFEMPPWFRVAGDAMRGVDVPLPFVTADGRLLGMIRGNANGFDFAPAGQRAAYNSYDNLVNMLTQATPQRFSYTYEKNQNGNVVANSWYDLWSLAGNPTQGTYAGAARTAVQYDDTSVGALVHGGNVSPQQKYLLSNMTLMPNAMRAWILYDRVLTYEACTMTAASQAMTNVLTAQRYASTGQPGLRIACIAQTNHNATAANLTVLDYTDNTGAAAAIPTTPTNVKIANAIGASSTVPPVICCPYAVAGAAPPQAPWLPLAVGTTGARDIVDYTFSAAPTGTITFVLMYPLAVIAQGASAQFNQVVDTVNSIGGAVRVYDGACLAMLMFSSVTGPVRITSMGDFGWTP